MNDMRLVNVNLLNILVMRSTDRAGHVIHGVPQVKVVPPPWSPPWRVDAMEYFKNAGTGAPQSRELRWGITR